MTETLKVRKIGNSYGFTVPKSLVDHLRVKEGDLLHVVAEPGGGLRVSPFDPAFEATVTALERTRSKYRNALRELAK
ncbi:MAG: AbrB/MazE/SpoVT family DNA-binding domain-containing protein [Gammaproteobacteria bacterium]|nr:AbrB/MazE/SpoVT family DNA-binding domain-containing protein [Gammaproteobacteria bacterium]